MGNWMMADNEHAETIGLCLFASWLTKHSIANACQNVGAFRSDGTTYECVERASSQSD